MVFSIVVSRWRLRAIFALRLPGLRLYFYTKIERRSFHTAWTRNGRRAGYTTGAEIGDVTRFTVEYRGLSY